MADLLQLRDALALLGQADAQRLSAQLNITPAMTQALLDRLIMMGRAERIDSQGAAPGKCRHCAEAGRCRAPRYRLRPTP